MDCRDFDPQLCIVQLTDFHFGKELQSNYRNRADDILGTVKNEKTCTSIPCRYCVQR